MVDWANPTTTRAYDTEFIPDVKGRDESVAKMNYSSDTNVPTNTIRWNSGADRFEIYNGSTWDPLSSLYAINVDTVDGVHAAGFAPAAHVGVGGTEHANATGSVSGFMSAADKTTLDGLGSIATENTPLAVSKGGTGSTTAAAARTAFGLGSAAIVDTGVSNGQIPVMDSTGYPAADGSQLTNLTSAAGFGAAATESVAAGGSGGLLRSDGSGATLTGVKGRIIGVTYFAAAAGAQTWTKPAGCTQVRVRVQAGGGGGGSGTGSNGGSGGGGGAYGESGLIDVSALSTVELVAGRGGAGGAGGGNDGAVGELSRFGASASEYVLCDQGDGGDQATGGGPGLVTGVGGDLPTGSAIVVKVRGGTGGGGSGDSGGGGGASFSGGGAPATIGNIVAMDSAEDSGGGGAGGKGSSAAGGDGADGYVVVEEYS